MTKTKKIYLALVAVLLSPMVNADTIVLLDDFNNDSTAGWTTQTGVVSEAGGAMSGTSTALATMDGQTANTIGVDAIAIQSVQYIALVLNYTSLSDNLFVKIQDNNANGLWDRVFFYDGNNGGSGISGTSYFDLAFEIASTYFQVSDNGDGTVSAFVQATNQTFGGTLTNTYSGTGIGLGFYGPARANNFYAAGSASASVPEPGTLALLGLGLVGMAARRKKKV